MTGELEEQLRRFGRALDDELEAHPLRPSSADRVVPITPRRRRSSSLALVAAAAVALGVTGAVVVARHKTQPTFKTLSAPIFTVPGTQGAGTLPGTQNTVTLPGQSGTTVTSSAPPTSGPADEAPCDVDVMAAVVRSGYGGDPEGVQRPGAPRCTDFEGTRYGRLEVYTQAGQGGIATMTAKADGTTSWVYSSIGNGHVCSDPPSSFPEAVRAALSCD